ncbi:MAG: hypothetical protein HGA19_16110 [Oscillochloris sp.]|nr:hypothetical protein [Oscillochloris sp.]
MNNDYSNPPFPLRSNSDANSDDTRQEDLDRVREIILGPDQTRTRLQRAETDRLRDILFGAQIEEYERRFADMRREQERTSSDLRQVQDRVVEFEKNLTRRFETLELEVRRFADELRREQDRQRSRDTLFQQLAAQMRQHEDTLVGTGASILDLKRSQSTHDADIRAEKAELIDIRDQIEQRTQSLRREIRSSEDVLRADLRRIADRLEDQKTDRRALASMLIELATRLETGNTVTDLLENLSGLKE